MPRDAAHYQAELVHSYLSWAPKPRILSVSSNRLHVLVGRCSAPGRKPPMAEIAIGHYDEGRWKMPAGWSFLLWWVLASTVGWAVGGSVGSIVSDSATVAMGVAVAGVLQWLVVRQQLPRSGWWAPSSIVAVAVAGVVGLAVGVALAVFVGANMVAEAGTVGVIVGGTVLGGAAMAHGAEASGRAGGLVGPGQHRGLARRRPRERRSGSGGGSGRYRGRVRGHHRAGARVAVGPAGAQGIRQKAPMRLPNERRPCRNATLCGPWPFKVRLSLSRPLPWQRQVYLGAVAGLGDQGRGHDLQGVPSTSCR